LANQSYISGDGEPDMYSFTGAGIR
jgi:hypothetical protein